MGGVDITVTTREKPEQSLFDLYLHLHPEMSIKGILGGKDRSKDRWGADIEMRRKAVPCEKYPIEIFGPALVPDEDDMAPEIIASTPPPVWLTNIGCELSNKQNWTDAEGLAVFIAKKYKGAVYTSEAGIIWSFYKS